MIRAIATSGLLALALAGCSRKSKPPKIAVANAFVGDCVNPQVAGVLSDAPRFKRADQDLDRDGQAELVLADKRTCRGANCYWNLFSKRDGCYRYIGTVAGQALEITDRQSDGGFLDIRGWWKLPSAGRKLAQTYRFRGDGYRLAEVLLCRQGEDDRLLCASEE